MRRLEIRKRLSGRCAALCFLCVVCSLAQARPAVAQAQGEPLLRREDFAYGLELAVTDAQRGAVVQTMLVPLAVYRGALRPDLGDVRVINGAGVLVPHALRALEPAGELAVPIEAREVRAPAFPLLAPAGAAPAVLDALALRIERGAIVALQSRGAPDAGAAASHAPVAYVLDAQALQRELRSLRVRFEDAGEPRSYLARLAIDASDDLTAWRPVVADAVLARLAHDGQLVTRDRIELGGVRAAFLRVRPVAGAALPSAIAEAWLEEAPGPAPAREREQLSVQGEPSRSEPGVFDYDLGGAFPVERVRVRLPTAGSLIQAELSVAAAKDETEPARKTSAIRARTSKRIYDDVFVGPLYRLAQEGRELESPAIELDGRRIRYLSLTVGEAAALERAPELEVEYTPAQLLFVAREPAPFELVYGSHAALPSTLSADALLAPLGADAAARLPLRSVTLGAQRTISGAAALTPPPPPPPIKTYVLWAVLIAGTLAVTALAVRLLRKLD